MRLVLVSLARRLLFNCVDLCKICVIYFLIFKVSLHRRKVTAGVILCYCFFSVAGRLISQLVHGSAKAKS